MPESPAGLDRTAYELKEGETYRPYVGGDGVAEFTFKAVLAGCLLGIVFGAANAYLGLMAGLTISTSIPIAVLTVVAFRALGTLGAKHTILELNMSQTIGSASSSVASGLIFTVPALFLWGMPPTLAQLTMLGMAGGLIGTLCMVPLRKFLIVREHGKLPYPEGVACAEVLVAAQAGGKQASAVFWGLAVGAVIKLLTDGLKLVGKTFEFTTGSISVAIKASPALIGVGFILGPRVAGVMVGGAALSAFVIIPAIAWWGGDFERPFYPETEKLIRAMSPGDLWEKYVRYIGAGAVGTAGIITLIRSLPVMVASFRLGAAEFRTRNDAAATKRVDRDLSLKFVAGGVLLVLAGLVAAPGVLGYLDSPLVKTVTALFIGVFAFFFVTVASRIVGLVGVTSNPVSGMTIATLLATSFAFWAFGWTDLAGKATALMVGTTVAIAASVSGDMSQDLKTGYLLGATPRWQQIGELAGVVTAAFFVCLTIVVLDETIGFGTKELPAPQGVLMKLVIDGVIEQNLPWGLICIGAGLAVAATLLKLPALAFSVGVYLPLSTMAPVFLGGLLRWLMLRRQSGEEAERRRKQGILFGSGLVGGEGLLGVGLAMFILAKENQAVVDALDWLSRRGLTPPDLSPLALNVTAAAGIVAILAIIAAMSRRNRQ